MLVEHFDLVQLDAADFPGSCVSGRFNRVMGGFYRVRLRRCGLLVSLLEFRLGKECHL